MHLLKLGSNQYCYRHKGLKKGAIKFIVLVSFIFLLLIACDQWARLAFRLYYFHWRDMNVLAPCENFCNSVRVEAYSSDKTPKTKAEIIANSHHPRELDHIWLRETGRGTNQDKTALHNVCKAEGKSNEFGYGGMHFMKCFDSFEESVKVVDAWLDKQSDIALCYYNQGIKTDSCDYVK